MVTWCYTADQEVLLLCLPFSHHLSVLETQTDMCTHSHSYTLQSYQTQYTCTLTNIFITFLLVQSSFVNFFPLLWLHTKYPQNLKQPTQINDKPGTQNSFNILQPNELYNQPTFTITSFLITIKQMAIKPMSFAVQWYDWLFAATSIPDRLLNNDKLYTQVCELHWCA